MVRFFFQTGLLFRSSIKENKTCRIFLWGMRKLLGIFDINLLIYNLKKVSKILTTFLSKNFRIQLVFDDFLTNKFRYFWKENNFFAKLFQLISFTKIRITLLRNFQVHLNYFTKKNRFYNYLRKTFFQQKMQVRVQNYTNAITKTVADLLVLINPPSEIYSHQAIVRQIPTILITNSSHNINNYNYSLAVNVHTETKLFIFITFIKKLVQFFFFTKNVKKLFWKFFFLKLKKKYIIKNFKQHFLFFTFPKHHISKMKTHIQSFCSQRLIKQQKFLQKKQQFIKVAKTYSKIFKKNYLQLHLFLYKQRQANRNMNMLLRRKNFNVVYKKQLQKKLKPSPGFVKWEKKQQNRFLSAALKKMPKLKIVIGNKKRNMQKLKINYFFNKKKLTKKKC